jgi:hypothetical protein
MTDTGRTVHQLDGRGYVRDWLVGPAWSHRCEDLGDVLAATGSPWGAAGRWVLTNGPDVAPLKSRLYARRPLITDEPLPDVVEDGFFHWRSPFGTVDSGSLVRAHTGWDGLVDWSQFCFTPEYRHAVAATVLEVDQAEWRQLEVRCTGPVAVWVGGELVGVYTDFSYMEPIVNTVRVRLSSGLTTVHLATWQVAFREVRHVAALRVMGLPVRVVIPSPDADEDASATAEQLLDAVSVDRWAVDDGVAVLRGPPGLALTASIDGRDPISVRLDGGSAELSLRHESSAHSASMLAAGDSTIIVRVDDPHCPVARALKIAALPVRHRSDPAASDPDVWPREVLEAVALAHPSTARAVARAELAPSSDLDPADIAAALAMIDSRSDCADFEAVGLVHALRRISPERWPAGARERVVESLLGFKFWIDQPGLDAMCYFTENHQLVWHTAELLVGELFADDVFSNTGWTGSAHATHGRELAIEWMRRKLGGGFSEFDSNAYMAIDSLALCSLVEFAGDDDVRQLAECVLDKVLLTLAANSWRGIHGAAHGRSYVPTLRSSRFEETAPIMWALWGMGSLNNAVLPATVLSTARVYAVPPVVRAIATDLPAEWDGRQVYLGRYRLAHDLLERPYRSDVRIWRTPDAMLSSVQDYRPGLPGLQEHIWSATLSAEVQVYATHPAADTVSSSARPNAWAGQRLLPRARQHRGTVLALHRLPGDDPVGHTHLWFPAPQMDEISGRGSWVAGRVGDGYVAVAARGGFDAATTGDEARQSWKPRGDGRAYVATVGRTAVHGSFDRFVAALTEPEFGAIGDEDPSVAWTDLDGQALTLRWSGPFTVDSVAVDLAADGRPEHPPHLVNPAVTASFGDRVLGAEWSGERLKLDVATGRRVHPVSGIDRPTVEAATS